MGEPAQTIVEIHDFRGFSTHADPTDLEPGIAQIQINVNGLRRGELNVRRGLREITFDTE